MLGPATTALLLLAPLAPLAARAQVTATGPNGPTNPSAPGLGAHNQTSESRLVSLNSVEDFCLFAPSMPNSAIGNVEAEVVAWCTKERNGARLIPDGAITAAHFVKTPLYVQVQGRGDLTKLNIAAGDDGGELDPHGAENLGNPIGGNVTSNVSGADVFYEEWMSFMSFDQFCLRICTAENGDISAALQCQHELDLMGCQFIMPGDYTDNSFTSCEGEAAIAPGLYPQPDGSTSTFKQLYTGTAADGAPYTIGDSATPSAPFSTPATSNCQTVSSISNGVTNLAVAGAASVTGAAASGAASGSASRSGLRPSQTSAAVPAGSSAGSSATSAGGGTSAAEPRWVISRELEVVVAAVSALFAGGVGVGALML